MATFTDGKMDGKSLKQIGGLSDQDILGMLQTGWMFYSQGKLESAQVMLEGVAAIDPENKYVHSALGALFTRQGRNEDALTALNRAVEMNPEDISAYVNRGEVLFRIGKVKESAQDFQKALAMDPEKRNPAANRARMILAGLAQIGQMARQAKK